MSNRNRGSVDASPIRSSPRRKALPTPGPSARKQASRSPLMTTPLARAMSRVTRSKNDYAIMCDHEAKLNGTRRVTNSDASSISSANEKTPSREAPEKLDEGGAVASFSIRRSARKALPIPIRAASEKKSVYGYIEHKRHSLTTPSKSTPEKKSISDSGRINNDQKKDGSTTTAVAASPAKRQLVSMNEGKEPMVPLAVCSLRSITSASKLVGYEKDVVFLRTVLRNCLNCVDSNSVLICGGRGSGKNTFLDHCLRAESAEEKATVLRLNGNVDASETNAFRFIGREMDISETDLSQMMSGLLEKCIRTQSAAIIILDDFDIFCSRNQTLLYNLFDLTQKCTCICIIGLTCRLDCIELLEKRVKSRMNHTIIHLTSPFRALADYLAFASQLFYGSMGPDDQASVDSRHANGKARKLSAASRKGTANAHGRPNNAGADCVRDLPKDLTEVLERLYSKSKSVRDLKQCLVTFVIEGSRRDKRELALNHKHDSASHHSRTSVYIGSLSYLELSVLLLAVKHSRNKNEEQFTCNVLMDYLQEIPAQMKITKGLLFKAVNNLTDYGLLIPANRPQKSALFLTEWTALILNVDENHVREALKANDSTLPAKLKQLLSTAH